MEGVPGCAQSRPGELGSGQCQSNAGASGPEEKTVGGGKEGGTFFLCFYTSVSHQFAPVPCPDLIWLDQVQLFVIAIITELLDHTGKHTRTETIHKSQLIKSLGKACLFFFLFFYSVKAKIHKT